MIRPGTLISRFLAAALLVAVVIAAVMAVFVPLAERWAELRDQRAHAAEMVTRLRAIAAEREVRAAELAAVQKTLAEAGLYLEAESPALAGARMGEMLREIAERHGAEVRSVRVVEGGEAERKVGRVALNVAMRGVWADLFPVIHALETGEPYLFLRALTISARERRRPDRVNEEAAPTLEVQFELYGFLPPEVAT
ncbi:MAG TPA: type II secretion system protein GspM [Thermohalobaculum sp.]|nr:type II secretion system protein GspM [Thermohalobaculum sp.]